MKLDTQDWTTQLAAFEEFLADSGRAPSTAAGYMLHLKWFSEAFAEGPASPSPREVSAWLDGHGWSIHTKRKTLVSLRAFYARSISIGQLQRSPLVGVSAATSKPTGPARTEPTALWDEPLYAFSTSLRAAGLASGTIRIRELWLVNLSHLFADPWAITTEDLTNHLSRADWSAAYKKSGRTSLRLFYKWAVRSGRTSTNPAADLDYIRVQRNLPRPAPTEAIMLARTVADNTTRLAMDLALYAGLRIGEVVALRMTDLLGDRILVNGKGGRQRLVPMHPQLREAFAAERSRRAELHFDSPWLFPSPVGDGHFTANAIGKRVSDALGPGWTAHTLRHRFATSAYQATTDLRAVQELLGHAKPETTAIYAAASDKALVRAVHSVSVL